MSDTDGSIHVRFSPNGAVTEIGRRPDGLTAQEWFNFLSRQAADCYRPLAGGRGFFRLGGARAENLGREAAEK